jgi:hypothetical protein
MWAPKPFRSENPTAMAQEIAKAPGKIEQEFQELSAVL